MHIPELHKLRKDISDTGMPSEYAPKIRVKGNPRATPPRIRMGTKGQTPVNPYSGNTVKVGTLSEFVDQQKAKEELLKTASLREFVLYSQAFELVKRGSAEDLEVFLEHYPELEKEAILSGAMNLGKKVVSGVAGAVRRPKAAPYRAKAVPYPKPKPQTPSVPTVIDVPFSETKYLPAPRTSTPKKTRSTGQPTTTSTTGGGSAIPDSLKRGLRQIALGGAVVGTGAAGTAAARKVNQIGMAENRKLLERGGGFNAGLR